MTSITDLVDSIENFKLDDKLSNEEIYELKIIILCLLVDLINFSNKYKVLYNNIDEFYKEFYTIKTFENIVISNKKITENIFTNESDRQRIFEKILLQIAQHKGISADTELMTNIFKFILGLIEHINSGFEHLIINKNILIDCYQADEYTQFVNETMEKNSSYPMELVKLWTWAKYIGIINLFFDLEDDYGFVLNISSILTELHFPTEPNSEPDPDEYLEIKNIIIQKYIKKNKSDKSGSGDKFDENPYKKRKRSNSKSEGPTRSKEIELYGNISPNSKIIISIGETIESVPRTQSVSNPNSDIKIKNIDVEESSRFTDMLEKFTESDNTSIKAGLFENFSSSDISGSNSATNGNKKILEYLMSLR